MGTLGGMKNALRDCRKSLGLSQQKFGELLGKSRMTIVRWETGARKPDPDEVPAICKKTGLTPREVRPDLAELLGDAA